MRKELADADAQVRSYAGEPERCRKYRETTTERIGGRIKRLYESSFAVVLDLRRDVGHERCFESWTTEVIETLEEIAAVYRTAAGSPGVKMKQRRLPKASLTLGVKAVRRGLGKHCFKLSQFVNRKVEREIELGRETLLDALRSVLWSKLKQSSAWCRDVVEQMEARAEAARMLLEKATLRLAEATQQERDAAGEVSQSQAAYAAAQRAKKGK